ncbi:DMT family transporter [Cohnella cellulosilytica]|uniref:DMT family transporter n=1 Tax=Cohnella cellulosilytica TaxID=986710 RepID=A0ABW2FGH2_9BACL
MIAVSIVLVLCSGLAHAVWNMFAKQSTDKPVFLWAIYAPSTVVLLPVLMNELAGSRYSPREWLFIGVSLAMQGVYAYLLAQTYKAGDLSQVYPIMRGMPTLLTPAAGVLLLGESLPLWGWAGIGCMLVGFLVMVGREQRAGEASVRPILLAVGVGLCITTYTLVDKVNLGYMSPLALLEVTNIGFVLGLTPAALKPGRLWEVVRRHRSILWLGAILSPGSYLLFLFAARTADVSTVAPLREVGIVFGTLLGLLVLKESQGTRRLVASAAVVTGIMMIAIAGH